MEKMMQNLRLWYMMNMDKIDFFPIGYTLCDLIDNIAYYWLKQSPATIAWDIIFISLLLYLRKRESK